MEERKRLPNNRKEVFVMATQEYSVRFRVNVEDGTQTMYFGFEEAPSLENVMSFSMIKHCVKGDITYSIIVNDKGYMLNYDKECGMYRDVESSNIYVDSLGMWSKSKVNTIYFSEDHYYIFATEN
jgi:hypothetical protein